MSAAAATPRLGAAPARPAPSATGSAGRVVVAAEVTTSAPAATASTASDAPQGARPRRERATRGSGAGATLVGRDRLRRPRCPPCPASFGPGPPRAGLGRFDVRCGRQLVPEPLATTTWLSTPATPATAAAVRSRSARPASWGTWPRSTARARRPRRSGCGQVPGAGRVGQLEADPLGQVAGRRPPAPLVEQPVAAWPAASAPGDRARPAGRRRRRPRRRRAAGSPTRRPAR